MSRPRVGTRALQRRGRQATALGEQLADLREPRLEAGAALGQRDAERLQIGCLVAGADAE